MFDNGVFFSRIVRIRRYDRLAGLAVLCLYILIYINYMITSICIVVYYCIHQYVWNTKVNVDESTDQSRTRVFTLEMKSFSSHHLESGSSEVTPPHTPCQGRNAYHHSVYHGRPWNSANLTAVTPYMCKPIFIYNICHDPGDAAPIFSAW